MPLKAKEIHAMLRSEGKIPRTDAELRATKTFQHISEACGLDSEGNQIPGKSAQITLGDFSIRDLVENLMVDAQTGESVGPGFVNQNLDPRHPGRTSLFEAGGAMAGVDSSLFMGITGQLLVVQVLKGYNAEEFVASGLVPTYSSPFEQEKWPGIAMPKDPGKNALRVAEGEPFRTFGFGEEYVQTPMTVKEGGIIPVTKEAIYFDRTGLITERARSIGYVLGLSKEKEILGCMIGGTTDPVYFVEKRQFDSAPVTLDLFQDAGAGSGARQLAYAYPDRPHPFVNDVPSNPLHDYTSIRLAEQYFSNSVDPNTGEPIVVGNPFVLAPHTRELDILQILTAENIWKLTQQGMTTAGAVLTAGPNVLQRIGLTAERFKLSRQLKAQLVAQLGMSASDADWVWFYGDVAQAFKYVENWPITVVQSPPNSEAEFNQDIVLRFKASRRGRIAIAEPRAWQRHNYLTETSGS